MKLEAPCEIGRKMDALGLWDALMSYNFAVRPKGTVLPYFCTALRDNGRSARVRFMMIEGWRTFHDFLCTRVDRFYGYYQTPMEMPHFELVIAKDGGVAVFRHDQCYMPRPVKDTEIELVSKILWESYGVMMRIETDRALPMRFADSKAMFSRVEVEKDRWEDSPLAIPDPQPYVEKITIPAELVKKAKDLPFEASECLELTFALKLGIVTREPRPRCCYCLLAIDGKGATVMDDRLSANPDGGLKAMWEGLAAHVLRRIVERGRVPGAIKVPSGRIFRMLRPLCMELPFKLSMHDSLPRLEAAFGI